jgi:hypothetical protein
MMRSRCLLLAIANQLRTMAQTLLSFAQTAKTDETAQIFVRHATLFEQDARQLEQQAEALR